MTLNQVVEVFILEVSKYLTDFSEIGSNSFTVKGVV